MPNEPTSLGDGISLEVHNCSVRLGTPGFKTDLNPEEAANLGKALMKSAVLASSARAAAARQEVERRVREGEKEEKRHAALLVALRPSVLADAVEPNARRS
ncbi:MAG: hypothetical protein L0Y64_22545 [Myxococcaceae bacterium]|nr:hypothetical protein [Myxococcaceae bacterium]